MKIGFLGAGQMGSAIAARLLEAKHELRVWNRTPRKLAPLIKRGAMSVATPREAAAEADAIVSMLANDEAVLRSALEGKDAAIGALPSGAIHIGMSTISPSLAARLTEAHAARGQIYVAAPVMGRPEAAQRGELVVLAAGPKEAVARCAPIFQAVGRETQSLGENPKCANAAKLAVNFFLASVLEGLGEAFALGERHGIDSARLLEILNGGMFKSPVIGAYGEKIAQEVFEPAGFSLRLGLKDTRLAIEAAESESLPLPIASLLHDRFVQAIDEGRGDMDWSAVATTGRPHPKRA